MNRILFDRTGVRGGGRVTVGTFTCADEPEFDGRRIDFDIVMLRSCAYRTRERQKHRRRRLSLQSPEATA